MLSGDIEKSRLARVRRGLKHIKEGKGRNKSRDSSLDFGGRLKVEETRRDEAVGVAQGRSVRGGLGRNWRFERGSILTI